MKVVIMAGGTGGHVFPALAVAQVLRERGHQVCWIGAPDSFESRTVPQHGFPIEFITVSGLRGKGVMKLLGAPLLLLRAIAQAWRVLRRQRPDVVLGMGGFASGPGGIAAWLQGRVLVIHEQNAIAGMTNRLLSRFARYVLQAFPGAFPERVGITVGNPVRAPVLALPPPEQRFSKRDGALQVLVIGGSQGARALNERVPQALALIPLEQRPVVHHQAGRTLAVAQAAYAASGVQAEIVEFITDMAAAYAWADLVICRAGASTVSELAAAGAASILVPFPAAVDDHQTHNATYLSKVGAGLLIQERDLAPQRLADELIKLTRPDLLRMARAARAAAQINATEKIVGYLASEGVSA
jgi:UDP-N-acetylglucosamine--N-acetylmuramyl-(pentapeptide) pyrophosphoryl-undecaprenol N-acetylglucosamine transferase